MRISPPTWGRLSSTSYATVLPRITEEGKKVPPHGKLFKDTANALGLVGTGNKGSYKSTWYDDGTQTPGKLGSAKGKELRAHIEKLTGVLGAYHMDTVPLLRSLTMRSRDSDIIELQFTTIAATPATFLRTWRRVMLLLKRN